MADPGAVAGSVVQLRGELQSPAPTAFRIQGDSGEREQLLNVNKARTAELHRLHNEIKDELIELERERETIIYGQPMSKNHRRRPHRAWPEPLIDVERYLWGRLCPSAVDLLEAVMRIKGLASLGEAVEAVVTAVDLEQVALARN